jgi:hypothetical protein
VKSYHFGVHAVDRALGYRQPAERLYRAPGGSLREARALHEGTDLPKGPVGVPFGMVDGHAERADAAYLGLFRREIKGDPEGAEGGGDLLQVGPRRHEAGEGHVAGRAADGLEVDVGQEGFRAQPAPGEKTVETALIPAAVGDLARHQQGDDEDDR